MASGQTEGPIKARYDELSPIRDIYLERARECSKYTIPHLVPPQGHSSITKLPTPFNSLGARGVNNISAKYLLALFPANTPFFRLTIDDFMLEKLTKKEGMRAEVEEALNSIERSVMNEIETTALRPAINEALKHLFVAGNVLLFMLPHGGVRMFRLDRYVVKRDPMGGVLEIIARETLSPMEIPESIRAAVMGRTDGATQQSPNKSVDLYTRVIRTATNWEVVQEIKGITVPGSKGTYPLDKSPWIPLRYIAVDNEDYGRSFVEEYLGDIKSLEALTKAIVQGAAAAAKVLFLVSPNGTTKPKVLAESESGDIKEGNAADVTVLQMDKYADFRVALDALNGLKESLSFAFQLNTAIQRQGERVTAEEIKYMAQELESTQGGVYSTLSQELQLPVVRRIMFQMEKAKKLPVLPSGVVKPAITTGIEAIGRGNDQTKLDSLLESLLPLGPEVLMKFLNVGDYIKRQGAAKGIDMKGLIRSQEEVDAAEQQAQQMAMMQQSMPNLINQGGAILKDQLAQQPPQ
jgi:hypothetical protein